MQRKGKLRPLPPREHLAASPPPPRKVDFGGILLLVLSLCEEFSAPMTLLIPCPSPEEEDGAPSAQQQPGKKRILLGNKPPSAAGDGRRVGAKDFPRVRDTLGVYFHRPASAPAAVSDSCHSRQPRPGGGLSPAAPSPPHAGGIQGRRGKAPLARQSPSLWGRNSQIARKGTSGASVANHTPPRP